MENAESERAERPIMAKNFVHEIIKTVVKNYSSVKYETLFIKTLKNFNKSEKDLKEVLSWIFSYYDNEIDFSNTSLPQICEKIVDFMEDNHKVYNLLKDIYIEADYGFFPEPYEEDNIIFDDMDIKTYEEYCERRTQHGISYIKKILEVITTPQHMHAAENRGFIFSKAADWVGYSDCKCYSISISDISIEGLTDVIAIMKTEIEEFNSYIVEIEELKHLKINISDEYLDNIVNDIDYVVDIAYESNMTCPTQKEREFISQFYK